MWYYNHGHEPVSTTIHISIPWANPDTETIYTAANIN